MTAELRVSKVEAFYGNIQALRGVDIEVGRGEIVTLIGANGAGKSTLLMTICGSPRAARGRIEFADHDITAMPTHEIIRLGIAHAPEGRRIFPRMTVYENLQMGATMTAREHFESSLARVYDLFPRLRERRAQRGGTLSGGEQQMLAIARALMGRPELLMLDEPSLGLAPKLIGEVMRALAQLHGEGLTLLLVEQNAQAALEIANRGYVLEAGQLTLEGPAQELLANPSLRAAYLGEA